MHSVFDGFAHNVHLFMRYAMFLLNVLVALEHEQRSVLDLMQGYFVPLLYWC